MGKSLPLTGPPLLGKDDGSCNFASTGPANLYILVPRRDVSC
jgi:hypothetical protein